MLVPCPTKAFNIGLALILVLCTASTVVQSAPTSSIPPRATAAEECPYDYGRDKEGELKQPNTLPKCLPSDPYTTYIKSEALGPADLAKPNGGRTIIVGDVHGHLDGLMTFLSKVEFDQTKDKLILAGDLVAKGPKSLEVLDKVRQMGAECVRGNHDDEVLRWRGYLDSLKKKPSVKEEEVEDDETCEIDDDDKEEDVEADKDDSEEQCEDEPETPPKEQPVEEVVDLPKSIPKDLIKGSQHHLLAQKMTDAQYEYLSNCPLMLTLPDTISKRKDAIYVMHAGINPVEGFDNQQPWTVFNVRNILDGKVPSRKKKEGTSWSKMYNDAESKRVEKGAKGRLVVYGHDAGRGLNKQQWSIGLDSGCVRGGELSGYIVEEDKVVSVQCSDVTNGGEDD
ncbi:hypothetical protein BGZ68_005348 [Mortierella alpina]|nr:hypothetical protein BGZ68_005348 [Mortierella alpina]